MTLLKTSTLNAIAVAVKLLVGLFLNKIIAVYVGPAGYAVIGQFQNAVTMITGFASGAINNGVVKYTAEYGYDEDLQARVWRTASRISVYCSFVVAIVILLFNQQLSNLLLRSSEYGGVFICFACSLVFFVFNALLISILNGKKEIGRYVIANICGSLIMAAVTAGLTTRAGLYGALLAIAVNQSVTFFATIYWCRKAEWFRLRNFIGPYDGLIARKLTGFATMALTSAAIMPLSQMLIRDKIGHELGWAAAGHWQGVWKLSEMYLMVVTTTLGVYYLPRISEITDAAELRREIIRGYKYILPVAALCSLTIYLLRDLLIRLLFTKDFIHMRDYFILQLIGDVAKIAGWLLGYVLWGKALVRMFVITEILFSIMFVIMSFVMIRWYGIYGVTGSYLIVYVLYTCTLMVLLKRAQIL